MLNIYWFRIAESKSAQMSKTQLAKYFAPLFIGNPQNPIEDGLKKLRDLKEQQMVVIKSQVKNTTLYQRFEQINFFTCRQWKNFFSSQVIIGAVLLSKLE